jgi:hypothetical protein
VTPADLVDKARASFTVAIHAGGTTGAHARDAFVDGIHTGMLCAAAAAILAAISVALLLNSDARAPRPIDTDEQRQAVDVPEQTALA